jgi:very-short-patch-repair endonuclease
VRVDIADLLKYVDLPETEQKFGTPRNNSSRVVVKCHNCDVRNESTILVLKNRIRRSGKPSCSKCSGRLSWDEGRRSKNDEYWTPERREAQAALTKDLMSKPDVKGRHKSGILSSYSGESGLKRKESLSRSSREAWADESFRKKESARRVQMWEDPKYREAQSAFKTPEFRLRASQTQKNLWEDPEYAARASMAQAKVWDTPGYKDLQSRIQKQAWSSPERRAKASSIQSRLWLMTDRRRRFEEMWASDAFRKLMSEAGRRPWTDPDYVSAAKRRSKDRWENEEYRSRIVSAIKAKWEDPAYRELKVLQGKTMWEDPQYRAAFGVSRASQMGRASSLEIVTARILDSFSLRHESQKPVGPYVFDFFLPDHDVFIECQGEYWHSLPGRQAKDAAKFSYLEQARPGSRILYLNERDFMNPVAVSTKVSTSVFGLACDPHVNSFDVRDVMLRPASRHESREFLNSFHYGGYGRGENCPCPQGWATPSLP